MFHYIFLRLAKQSQFIPLQNVLYFITPFLVRKIFTFYLNDVLLFKCPFPGPKGQSWNGSSVKCYRQIGSFVQICSVTDTLLNAYFLLPFVVLPSSGICVCVYSVNLLYFIVFASACFVLMCLIECVLC